MPAPPLAAAGPWTGDATMTFQVADPGRLLAGVRLLQEVRIRAELLEFRPAGRGTAGRWELTLDRPPVSRMEYLLELRYPDGTSRAIVDPANPRQVAGAFGPKSVLEFPGYSPPAWLAAPAAAG